MRCTCDVAKVTHVERDRSRHVSETLCLEDKVRLPACSWQHRVKSITSASHVLNATLSRACQKRLSTKVLEPGQGCM